MDQFRPDRRDEETSSGNMRRRSFLGMLASALGGAVALRAGEVHSAAAQGSDTGAQAPSLSRHLPDVYHAHPAPTYIPPGYELNEIFTDRPDGFGLGSEQLVISYVNPKHPLGFSHPLEVYAARRPRQTALSATERRTGQPVALSLGADETVQAEYHDGFWVPDPGGAEVMWASGDIHSVSFAWRGFAVAVRGSRLTGVGYGDLVRVANSVL